MLNLFDVTTKERKIIMTISIHSYQEKNDKQIQHNTKKNLRRAVIVVKAGSGGEHGLDEEQRGHRFREEQHAGAVNTHVFPRTDIRQVACNKFRLRLEIGK